MRSPSDSDARKNGNEPTSAVGRDPSYPDRARIDSDVRAFLRPASSPWIVFDRDSKVDDFAKSALRVGAVFASSPALRQPSAVKLPQPTIIEAPMFPVDEAPAPVVEPSTVVLAADVMPETARTRSVFSIPDGLVRKRPSLGIVAAAVGVVLGVSALVAFRPSSPAPAAAAAAPTPAVVAPPAPVVEPAPVVVETAPPVEVTKPAVTEAEPKKKVLGKLTIKADPRTKNVWMDGKRMLGSGHRTFLVACGMHVIAVNDKTDAKDVEIPCNGEYAIGK